VASLTTHAIGLPPILHAGAEEMKQRVGPAVCRGEKLVALAITEPGAGSDVASLAATARIVPSGFQLNGVKVPITSGVRSDYITVAARTLDATGGDVGISLFLVESGTPGFTQAGAVCTCMQ
jgi:acyl-CoA dehydrogenase